MTPALPVYQGRMPRAEAGGRLPAKSLRRRRRYHTVPRSGAANMHALVTSEVKRLSIHPVGCAGQEDPPHVRRSLSSIRQVRAMGMPRHLRTRKEASHRTQNRLRWGVRPAPVRDRLGERM